MLVLRSFLVPSLETHTHTHTYTHTHTHTHQHIHRHSKTWPVIFILQFKSYTSPDISVDCHSDHVFGVLFSSSSSSSVLALSSLHLLIFILSIPLSYQGRLCVCAGCLWVGQSWLRGAACPLLTRRLPDYLSRSGHAKVSEQWHSGIRHHFAPNALDTEPLFCHRWLSVWAPRSPLTETVNRIIWYDVYEGGMHIKLAVSKTNSERQLCNVWWFGAHI